MKFVSTISALELNVNVNTPVALSSILNTEDVHNFFEDATQEEILLYTVSVNDMDAETLRSSLGQLLVDDDMKIEVELPATVKKEENAPAKLGTVTVTRGGGFGGKTVAVTDGITSVSDVLTPSVADFFAASVESLKNMNIYINDTAASLCSVLHSGDTITLEARKAGDKGMDSVQVHIIDGDGDSQYISVPERTKVRDVLKGFTSEASALCCNLIFGEDMSYEMIEDDLEAVNGASISEGLLPIVLSAEVDNSTSLQFASLVFVTEEGYSYEDDDMEEDTEVGDVEAEHDTEVLTGPAVGTMGTVKIMSAGGWTSVEVSIVNGVTKLKDVVVTNKVLNKFAMTPEQVTTLIPTINDNSADMYDVLHTGDVVVLTARKAGDKGIN